MNKLYNKSQISNQIKILADAINNIHRDNPTPTVFIGLLNGCFMFYSDLVKNLDFDIECDFMRVKSYEGQKQGDIKIVKDIEASIKDKHIYLVDDILDSGNTMKEVIKYLNTKHPSSISITTLLTRESSPTFEYPTYSAFTIKDEWILGYGMDNDKGYMRNYPEIFEL